MWRGLLLVVSLVGLASRYAAGAESSLGPYGVAVNGGAGVYLGNGLILSVAHVVGGGIVEKPKVMIANRSLIATVVKESPFEQLDLALLQIDEASLPVSL